MMKKRRYSLFSIFAKGVLFFFSFERNPIEEYAREQKGKNDAEKIFMDWCNVGNDIRNAYGKVRTTEKGC